MKKLLVTALLTATVAGGTAQVKNQSHGYPIDPVPFTSVKVTDSFWGQRLNASREVTIPLAFSKCEETGRCCNFGITFLVPYNKDFGRITRFLGNDLATVLFAAFCYELRSNNSL